MSYKEYAYVNKSTEERMLALQNPDSQQDYSRFYSLGPQHFPEGEVDINAPEHA